MAVIKLSSSGKSLLFIDDSGNQFFTSRSWLNGLLAGRFDNGFVVLKRLPFGVPVGKFPVSEVFDPDGLLSKGVVAVDGLSVSGRVAVGDAKSFVDKDVW